MDAYKTAIFACMGTTLNIDDDLLAEARLMTGQGKKVSLVRMGLEALIGREAARSPAVFSGTMRDLKVPARGRSGASK